MAEFSITRINQQHYYLISGIGSDLKDLDWLQQHSDGYEVSIDNVTEDLGVLLLTGPKARDILQELTVSDISHKAFPWLSAQTLTLDSAEMLVIRVSYAGELGYELHMPTYQMPSIYNALWRVGAEHGLRDFGSYALNSMRLEKAYRGYGAEFTEEISALESGMQRFVDLSRDFIGADNLRQRQQNPLDLQLVLLAFDDDIACECYGNEAVYHGDELIGLTTSGGYGHRVGYSLSFAYINPDQAVQGNSLTVLTTLGKRQAHVELDAVYDPKNEKMRV